MRGAITKNNGQLKYSFSSSWVSAVIRVSYPGRDHPYDYDEFYTAGEGLVVRFTSTQNGEEAVFDVGIENLLSALDRASATIQIDEILRQLDGVEVAEINKPKLSAKRKRFARRVRESLSFTVEALASKSNEIAGNFQRLSASRLQQDGATVLDGSES